MDASTISICSIIFTLFLTVSVHRIIALCYSVRNGKKKRGVKIEFRFNDIGNDEAEGKANFHRLLAAVISNYPQLVRHGDQNKKAELEVAGETIYLVTGERTVEMMDLDHVVDHLRYCVYSMMEDPKKCIELMRHYPGPSFEASIIKLRVTDPNNAVLNILADPPVQTHTNLVIYPLGYDPQEWMKCYSVIHTPKQYTDSLERNSGGFNGLRRTNKENIQKMLKLNMIHQGDGLYLVRTRKIVGQYAHVAVVTDPKLMKFVHATKNSKYFLCREYGKIVEDEFEKVVKKKDECFIVRFQHKELSGRHIANRARTFTRSPAITFTYNVIHANCEVVFTAAAGNFKKCSSSLQGRLVGEPFSDGGKKIAGLALEQIQRSPEAGLLEKLYFRLLENDQLHSRESPPSRQPFPATKTDLTVEEIPKADTDTATETDNAVHLTAITRSIPNNKFISGCLGEYKLTHTEKGGCQVYRHVDCCSSSRYLYQADGKWYCSYEIGRVDGKKVFLRNSNNTHQLPMRGWEYNKSYNSFLPSWVFAPTLTVNTGHLTPCGVVSVHVQGGGDADGDYHHVPGKHVYGRYLYRQVHQPHCKLSVDGNEWCIINGETVVMQSEYASMCPADPLAGFGAGRVGGNKWKCKNKFGWLVKTVVSVQCSEHRY